jgi:PAS domain S-box-containing protein
MEKQHVRKLVVMEDEHLYGILSQTDIFQAVKRKLHEEEEKNYKLLESSKSNIYTLVPDGKITYINPSFMKLLKVSSPDELVGEYFLPERFWLNSEDREELLKELRSGVVQAKDLNLKNSSGKRVYVTFFSTFTKDACGKIDGIQGVLHDVTDKKELAALRVAEEALRASKQKLKASNEQLKAEICKHKQTEGKLRQTNINLEDSIERANCMTTEALAASKSKSEFLANMSHEIHTPMNAIIGFSDVLAAEDLTNDQKRYINLIQSAGHDLLATIDNILDFARIEAGKLKTEITDYLLSDILGDIDSLLRPAAAAKGLEFKISRCDNLPAQLRTDPVRLRQCLINLIKNAIKFTEEGHIYLNITLEYRDNKDEPYIRFDVEDTGIGIEEEHQQLVLEAFSQADYSVNRKYGGTGLGLAITKQLCELLGGELSFVSQTGEGSVFTLTMPSVADVNETEPKSNAKSVADSNAEHLPH